MTENKIVFVYRKRNLLRRVSLLPYTYQSDVYISIMTMLF